MNKSSFLANFRMVVNAPGGVRRLRELVLTLAIRGELVHSEKVEEDGQALLARIISERELLVSNGDVSYASESSIAPEASLPFTIPQTWTTASLGQLSAIVRGVTFPASAMQRVKREDVVVCLKTSNVQDEIDWENLVYIAPDLVKREDQWLRVGDIVMSMANSRDLVGKVAIVRRVPTKAAIGGFLGILRPILVLPEYLFVVLRSTYIQELLRQGASQTTNIANVSLAKLRPTAVPLPPLEEQKRIVAKVDELMRLCDRLQAQQQEREKLLPLLSRANHTRFVTEPTEANLRAVFPEERRSSPSCLRETVLSLAVKGLLVRQDESDQPAEQLIEDILSHILASDGRGASRLAKKVQEVLTTPFPIPHTWKWIRLGAISESIDYGTSHKADSNSSNVPVYRMGDIQDGELRDDNLKYVPQKIDDLPDLFLQPGDLLFNRTNSAELVGKAAIFRGPPDKYTFASYLIRVRLPKEFVDPEYINLCFLSPYFRSTQIAPELTQQCGQANFNGTKLANTLFPLPPKSEQVRIKLKVKAILETLSRLESMHTRAKHVASNFAATAVGLLTGMSNAETKQVKPPKTEVVTALKVAKKPKKSDAAPLAKLLSEQKAVRSAKTLWQLSGLEIDVFYRQLKTEMANGWIDEDKVKRAIQEVEAR